MLASRNTPRCGRPLGVRDLAGRARRVMPDFRNVADELGPQIRALRHERQVSADELGAAIGVDGSLIRQWERGAAQPSLRYLAMIAAALDLELELRIVVRRPAVIEEAIE